MRLKTLTLNGYKTFASKMQFHFGDGITCIIGPNGSGKSNVADGIRWALGEQQFSLLRGKRTDDMIFSGSAKRPRASMAEVILTFDNSDGFFPIEFSEIEIGRRAYRDGANEYVLNSNRVRLRDVSDLLGHSGLAERTYTVIGQGLVDNALAQKPEERRALFEEAAGIGAYRDRREDALRKLEETRHNLERARDILTEITPRLGQLERQAQRARQYKVLADELDGHTRTFLGYHYRALLQKVDTTAQTKSAAQHAVNDALAAVQQWEAQAEAKREERMTLQRRLAEAQPKRDEARRASETASRELAVMRERAASLERQLADAKRDLEQHSTQIETYASRASEAAAAYAIAMAAHAERQTELNAAQAVASGHQQDRAALEQQRSEAQRRLAQANSDLQKAQNEIAGLRARRDALQQQLETMGKRTAELGNQRETELTTFNSLSASMDHDTSQVNLFDSQFDTATQTLEATRNALTTAQAAHAAAEAEEKMTSRMTLFADMRAMQSGDELAAAATSAGLPGVRGVLSSFIHISSDEQKAAEAALGDLLDAVVIAPQDSEAAEAGLTRMRAWLTEQPSGRVAVVMSHALRPFDEERANNDRILNDHARSNGAKPLLDVINAPDWLQPALRVVAGRKFICRDLDTARTLAAQLPDGSVCVTRDGEVATAIGAMSLPAGARAPIVLGAEAPETPEMPDHETAMANLQKAKEQRDAAQREFDAARKALADATAARDTFAKETIARRARIDDAQRKVSTIEDTLAALAGDMAAMEEEIAGLEARVEDRSASLAELEAAQVEAREALNTAEVALGNQLAGGWLESFNASKTALATALAAMQNAAMIQREREAAHANMIAQRESKERRLAQLQAEAQSVQASLQERAEAAAQAEAAWREADAGIAPIQGEIAGVEAELNALDAKKREAERGLRERESQMNAASLEEARVHDELANLKQRATELMMRDEGAEAKVQSSEFQVLNEEAQVTDAGELADSQQPTANPSVLDSLPIVDELPEGVEERIVQLRNQIKRLGAINYEAQAEFEELQKRHTFITEQSSDLEKASTSLQQVIAELNDVMKVTFRQTFDAIANAFQNTFKVLFGGGQAKLTLTNAENIDECGVEIQAQPPGKRPQSLALLSGGERSLTATALLFAILQVKPTPFCVLDEVDAALDESNVGRFRSMVESLSDQTQFILITHNRRTVEAASTIYGITMGADGASTALSLRLEDVK
jgi:chromosome segregation protein